MVQVTMHNITAVILTTLHILVLYQVDLSVNLLNVRDTIICTFLALHTSYHKV